MVFEQRHRVIRVGLAIFVLVSLAVVAVPSTASASCSASAPCIAEAYSQDTPPGFQGALAYATPFCWSVPSGSYEYFVVRLTNAANTNWIMVGFVNSLTASFPILGQGTWWEDKRPGYGVYDHPFSTVASPGRMLFQVHRVGKTTFSVQAGKDSGVSTSNSMYADYMRVQNVSSSGGARTANDFDTVSWYQPPNWVRGMPTRNSSSVTAPSRFAWISNFTEAYAGIPC
jgi:hypothetical protein